MSIFIRVLGLLLLAGVGYRAYLLYGQVKGFWPLGRDFRRGLDALLGSAEPVILASSFILAGAGLSIMVLLGRRSADGGKPRFQFDAWAKFFAAIALLNGVLSVSRIAVWLYGLWRAKRFDDLMRSPEVLQTLAQAGFELAMGVVTLILVFLVLLAPRAGGSKSARPSPAPAPAPIVRRAA